VKRAAEQGTGGNVRTAVRLDLWVKVKRIGRQFLDAEEVGYVE
jgi:hypothetical protein